MDTVVEWAAELAALIFVTVLGIGSLAVAAVHGWGWLLVGLAAAGFVVGFTVRMRRNRRRAVADSDQLVGRLRRGDAPADGHPLTEHLDAWRSETQRDEDEAGR